VTKFLLPVAALIALSVLCSAPARANPGADIPAQSQSSTQVFVNPDGSSTIQTQVTTVLPGGIVQQSSSAVSESGVGFVQYKTLCTGSGCQVFVLTCEFGQCQYRQVPIFNYLYSPH
jgi:hypothetical protein